MYKEVVPTSAAYVERRVHMDSMSRAYKVELQIPYCLGPEISSQSDLWQIQERDWRDLAQAM